MHFNNLHFNIHIHSEIFDGGKKIIRRELLFTFVICGKAQSQFSVQFKWSDNCGLLKKRRTVQLSALTASFTYSVLQIFIGCFICKRIHYRQTERVLLQGNLIIALISTRIKMDWKMQIFRTWKELFKQKIQLLMLWCIPRWNFDSFIILATLRFNIFIFNLHCKFISYSNQLLIHITI